VAVGGSDGVHRPKAVLRTSDGRHFHTVARLPHGVRYAGVALLDGQLWVLGGEASGRELREVWRVDLASGQVTAVGRLPRPLGHEAVIPVGSRLLVLGGRTTSSTMTDRMWWFTPATRTWRKAGRLPYPLADAPAVRLGTATYLVGGETPHFTRRVLRVTVR
jgi:N-acetylneuraminic acid mutarotase